MGELKAGCILQHRLTGRKVIVLSVCSDGVIVCRTCDGNGVYSSANFYKEELEEVTLTRGSVGFEKEE